MSCDIPDDPVESAITHCAMTQCMIDITSKQLDGLRTQCSVTEEITQKEIRESEVRMLHCLKCACNNAQANAKPNK